MSTRNALISLFALLGLGVMVVPCIWAFLYLGVYLGYGNFKARGHQEFATNGVSQIQPAMEMDQLFADCRHFITYGPSNVPLFNSVAYFGDRYELTMQVEVAIHSKTSGTMVGTPQFYLSELNSVSVSPSGQVGASFSRNLNFGPTEWRRIYDSGGDFSTIAFRVNETPVPNFQKYAAASRPSN